MSDPTPGSGVPAGTPSPVSPARLEQAMFEVKKVIVGQDRAIERLMVCLLSGGHALLEGVPGLAKTLAAETLSTVVGGTYTRLQFTPDLLPADITGTRIYRASTEHFDVELGPIFANFVLADEINRAPAKVQSALLEVMAEHHVSIGGETFDVPTPFLVLATQNPIESEGVYPLPEAQRDRFLMKIVIGYPSPAEEIEIVHRMGVHPPHADQVLSLDELVDAAADGRRDLRRPRRRRVRREPRARHPQPAPVQPPRARRAARLRRQPPGQPRPRGRRTVAGAAAGPYLRPAPGRLRHRPRRAPSPPRAELRGPGPGPDRRPPARPPPEHGAGALASPRRRISRPAAASRCRRPPPRPRRSRPRRRDRPAPPLRARRRPDPPPGRCRAVRAPWWRPTRPSTTRHRSSGRPASPPAPPRRSCGGWS